MFKYNNKLFFTFLFSSLFLVGCQEEEVVDLPSPIYEVAEEQNFVSVRDYTELNNIKLEEEVIRDINGKIVRPSEYDITEELKSKVDSSNYRSFVKLMHGLYLGLNDISFETLKEDNGGNIKEKYYLKINFDLYNTNTKEMSLGIFNSAELNLSNKINLKLDNEYHNGNKDLIDFNNYKEVIKEDSERNITMYFKFNNKSDITKNETKLDVLNVLGDIKLINLGMSYLLQDPIYVEDFTEEDSAIYKENLAKLGITIP